MANRQNRKGRSRGSGKFVMLPEYVLRSEAYRHLTVYGRALLVEFIRKYDGTNNGFIGMSLRDGAKLVGCADQPIRKALKDLQAKGFLKIAKKGAYSVKYRHATEWTLTEYPVNNTAATKDFMGWVAPPPQPKRPRRKKSNHGGTRDALRRYEIPHPTEESAQILANGGTRYRCDDQNVRDDGGTRYRTYIHIPEGVHETETLKHIANVMPDWRCHPTAHASSGMGNSENRDV